MFRDYRNSYATPGAPPEPCDSIDAACLQKVFAKLPEKHRWALCWCYCKPYIPVMRVRQALGLTTPALADMLHTARTMLLNLSL